MKYRGSWSVVVAGMLLLPAVLIAQDSPPTGVTIYVVQRGDSLFEIALRYGLTVDQLAQLNGITDTGNIQVGQRLLVPAESAPPEPLPQVHTVQAGETLGS